MALSKSVNYFVNTVCYDSIAIGPFNANDGEAIQSTLPHRAAKICLKSPKSAEHDVAGITARIEATFENSGSFQTGGLRSTDQQPSNSNVLRSTARTYFKTRNSISFKLHK